jgi:hypothetical protein
LYALPTTDIRLRGNAASRESDCACVVRGNSCGFMHSTTTRRSKRRSLVAATLRIVLIIVSNERYASELGAVHVLERHASIKVAIQVEEYSTRGTRCATVVPRKLPHWRLGNKPAIARNDPYWASLATSHSRRRDLVGRHGLPNGNIALHLASKASSKRALYEARRVARARDEGAGSRSTRAAGSV